MKRRLYAKILMGYLLFGVIAFFIICTLTEDMVSKHLLRQSIGEMKRESSLLAAEYAERFFDNSITADDLQTSFTNAGELLSLQIRIMDDKGHLILDSDDKQISQNATRQEYHTISGFQKTDFAHNYYMIGDFYGTFPEEYLTVYVPIQNETRTKAYLLVHRSLASVMSDGNEFMNITFYTTLLLFICAFIILAIFSYTTYTPLRKIAAAADKYAKGDFSPTINVNSNDEIGYLANTLNYMAKELNMLEEDQRKFISNVSHDFRSPLTSIKGYIEAILDGTIPSGLHEKYLRIILFETERLNKLTQSLLDLNRFGRHGMMLDMNDFDINQLITTTTATFEGTCREKSLQFEFHFERPALYVIADLSKIQQVLYNLIDNAVKFSRSNTTILVSTSTKNEKVLISVKDNGIGIPSDCINKIWDRFYKTDLSRGKDKRGTGLGLAIVKEIVQAHEEHINVVSTEDVGTEFMFTLPLSQKEFNK